MLNLVLAVKLLPNRDRPDVDVDGDSDADAELEAVLGELEATVAVADELAVSVDCC